MQNALDAALERLKTKIELKRDQGRKRIEDEYLADIRSLERLRALEKEEITTVSSIITKMGGRDKIGPAAATREAINTLSDLFTIRDIDDYIQRHHPTVKIMRTAIASVLNKFTSTKEVELVERNKGKVPGKYRSVKRNNPQMQIAG